MSLAPFQEIVYYDRADLWEPDVPVPANSFPGDQAYTLRQTDVACRFGPAASVDELAAAGLLVESDDLTTTDKIRLPNATEVESSWILVNRTLVDGEPGPYYGKCWIGRGSPRRRINAPNLPATGRVVVYATKIPDNLIPAEIQAYYA